MWQACAEGAFDGCIAATELTNLYYIARRLVGRDRANTMVRVVLDSFSVLAITDDVLRRASAMSGPDFEDDVIATCAALNSVDFIVTRNSSDFAGSAVPAITPTELRARIGLGASDT